MRPYVLRNIVHEMTQPGIIYHYHRVPTDLWLVVARSLERIIVDILECPSDSRCAWLNAQHAQVMLDFLDEMEFGYVHPRRSSLRRSLLPHRRRASASSSAHPSTNKT